MRFKIDENLPVEIAELLQQAGYDAETVKLIAALYQQNPRGKLWIVEEKRIRVRA